MVAVFTFPMYSPVAVPIVPPPTLEMLVRIRPYAFVIVPVDLLLMKNEMP